ADPAGEFNDVLETEPLAHLHDAPPAVAVADDDEVHIAPAAMDRDMLGRQHQALQSVIGTNDAGVAHQPSLTATELGTQPRVTEIRPPDGVADDEHPVGVDAAALDRDAAHRFVRGDDHIRATLAGPFAPAGDGQRDAKLETRPASRTGLRHHGVLVEE